MIEKSVERLVEGQGVAVSGASVLQHRSAQANVASVIGVVAGLALGRFVGGGGVVAGIGAGLGAGFAQLLFVKNWVIARIGDEVVLCRSSAWLGKAKDITHRSVVVSLKKAGLLSDVYESPIGELIGGRTGRDEISRILGNPQT